MNISCVVEFYGVDMNIITCDTGYCKQHSPLPFNRYNEI